MATAKMFRLWRVGAACLLLAVTGCAGRPGSLWGRWADSSHPSRFSSAKRELKDPTAVHLKWAQLQEHSGNIPESRQSYQFVLGENPKSVDAILGLARLDQLAGRPAEAEQGFQKALKVKPNSPHVLNAVGQFYASQERWEPAVEKLNAAMMAAPDEPTYRYHLAVALARSGNLEAALPHFAKTIGEAEAHYNIGYILYQQGNLAAAEQQFMQATAKKPALREAQEMLDDLRQAQENKLMLVDSRVDRPHSEVVPSAGPSRPMESSGAALQFVPARPAMRTTEPSGNSHPAPTGAFPTQSPTPAGMTPQQLEQMRNQFGANPGL